MSEKERRPVGRARAILLALGASVLAAAVTVTLVYRSQGQDRDQGQVWEEQLFAMDTVMTLTAYGPEGQAAVDEAARELRRLDALWSVESPSSEIAQLNAGTADTVSPDTAYLLGRALDISRETGGLFDPTIYPLMTLWGFHTDHPHVPRDADIQAVLPLVDSARVTLSGERVSLAPGQELDLGGIAKGFASARVMEIFRAHGVESGMVSLGGNIQTLGTKPDGSPWRVGVRDPEGGASSYLAVLPVEGKAVITSGGYERFFEEKGRTYIHILDPRTGRSAQSDLQSATVISADGALADALSTALYVMGSEEAAAFWARRAGQFDMVLLTRSGELLVTEGVAGQLETQLPVRVLRAQAEESPAVL